MTRTRPLFFVCLVAAVACWAGALGAQPEPPSYTIDTAPAELQPAITRARAASDAMLGAMQNRLVELLPKGAGGALDVCRRESYTLAADLGMQQGLAMGRTSHKLRNPQNAPRPWAAPIVAANAGKKASAVKIYAVDLGDRVGVLQPIAMGEACSLCHGDPSWMTTDVAEALKQGYPNDRATGFAPGDLRGWFWAEVPKK